MRSRFEGLGAAFLVAFALALTVWAWWPMFLQYPNTATLDGRAFHHLIASGKASILAYHELPLWNPFDCRGIPLWDHPENITASPILLLLAGLDTTKTLIAWHVFHAAVGFVGMWLLARRDIKLSQTGALLASVLWTCAAGHTTQYAGAHEALISFYNVPLLFFLWRRAETDLRYAVGTGLALAWMVYDGATYPLPYTVVVLCLETLLRFSSPRRTLRIILAGAIVGVVGFTVGASRLLPLMAQLAGNTRNFDGTPDGDHITIAMLRDMYTLRSAGYLTRLDGQQYVFGEYLTYIGWSGVLLAFVGLAATASELWWLVALGIMTATLMLGHFASWAPWTLLQGHVFPFKSMRVAARFRLIFMMPISLWIALATDRVPAIFRRYDKRLGTILGAVMIGCAFLVAGDAAGLGQELIAPRFSGPPETRVARSTRFYYGGPGLTPDTINQPQQNRAYLGCRMSWAYHAEAPLWTGDVPQAKALDETAATIEVGNRTANTFTVDLDVKRPTRILLNSAFAPGWQTDVGTVVEHEHLLAVDVSATGRYRMKLRYWPQRLTLGLVLSAISLAASLFFILRRPRRKIDETRQ
jgi:hypothetical protein